MKRTKPALLHVIGALYLVTLSILILIHLHSTTQVVLFVMLLGFFIVIVVRAHLQLSDALHAVDRYDTVALSQERMLTLHKAMLELSNHMTKVDSLNELLDIILKKAIEVMPEAEFGSILVMNKEGQLEFKAIYGFDQNLFEVKLDPKESYQWRATGGNFSGPLIIQDLSQQSKDFMTEETYSTMSDIDALSPKSSLSAPLLVEGEFFGSINIDSLSTHVFGEEHKKLMAYFANEAIIAIMNHQYYEKMSFLSKYDGLTGVMNRHYFQEQIEKILREKNYEREPITFVLMDLNHFKDINDQYGHASGDHILTYFAQTFSQMIAPTDLFARYGGDEFIAVFFNSDRVKTLEGLKTIHETIEKETILLTTSGQEIHCLFSYGAAEYPAESSELKTLIHLADQRMYEYKKSQP